MRIFKTKWFAKFAKQNRIEDADLIVAITRAEAGHIDADLGGGVIKQRIPRKNEGRSGGYRSIVIFKKEDRAFFVYGFLKSGQTNIGQGDLEDFRIMALTLLAYTDESLKIVLDEKAIVEVKNNE